MKLRTKTTLFFGIFFLVIISATVFFIEYVVTDTLSKQTIHNFRNIAEQSEGTFLAFLGGMKTRVIDWTSDPTIQRISKEIIGTAKGTPERAALAREFADYVSSKKMPYDDTVVTTELLDRNGIVVAATRPDRIGVDERSAEVLHGANKFSATTKGALGDVYFGSIVFIEDRTEPVFSATTRMPDGNVLLVSFSNMKQLSVSLGIESGTQVIKTIIRTSSMAFLESYQTSDIFIVNRDHLLVTPSRYVQNIEIRKKVETLPVVDCLYNGKEVSEEYDNHRGVRVIGASMCFKDNGLVLVVEIQKDEIFEPVYSLLRFSVAGGFVLLGFGVLGAFFFVRRPLLNIKAVVDAAKQVSKGNFDWRVKVNTKDEIGYLSTVFNTMTEYISATRKELQESKEEVEKDLAAHKKSEELLELSKKATINILEDLLETKNNLQTESSKLQTVISSIHDGLVLIDAKHIIVLVNPKISEMLGIPSGELLGKDLRTIMKIWKKGKDEVPPEKWPSEEMFLLNSTVTTTLEDELFVSSTRKESQIPVTLSASPLGVGSSGGILVIRDATSDHNLDAAKSGFISVASHQLRTPLTSIRWYSEMLLSGDVGVLNKEQKDFMDEIHGGAERLYQTVDLLLGISRVESGKIKLTKEPIDLTKFTEDIKKELSPQSDEKNLTISILPPEGDHVTVNLDSIMLRQVILNLFSNAIRYTNEKGTIEVKWDIAGEKKEVLYSVRDNGIGIPVSQRGSIFSKFFRAENARIKAPDGSGLGLALVKELVESWGGKVWFETEEGKGSTFFFTVPLANETLLETK